MDSITTWIKEVDTSIGVMLMLAIVMNMGLSCFLTLRSCWLSWHLPISDTCSCSPILDTLNTMLCSRTALAILSSSICCRSVSLTSALVSSMCCATGSSFTLSGTTFWDLAASCFASVAIKLGIDCLAQVASWLVEVSSLIEVGAVHLIRVRVAVIIARVRCEYICSCIGDTICWSGSSLCCRSTGRDVRDRVMMSSTNRLLFVYRRSWASSELSITSCHLFWWVRRGVDRCRSRLLLRVTTLSHAVSCWPNSVLAWHHRSRGSCAEELTWVCSQGRLQALLDRHLLVTNLWIWAISPTSAHRLAIYLKRSSAWHINIFHLHRRRHLTRHVTTWLHRALWSTIAVLVSQVSCTDDSLVIQLFRQSLHLGEVSIL